MGGEVLGFLLTLFSQVASLAGKAADHLQKKEDRWRQTQAVLVVREVKERPHRWRVENQGALPAEIERVELVFQRIEAFPELPFPLDLEPRPEGIITIDGRGGRDIALNEREVFDQLTEKSLAGYTYFGLQVIDSTQERTRSTFLPIPATPELLNAVPQARRCENRFCPEGTSCIPDGRGRMRCRCSPTTCDGCCIDSGKNGYDDQCITNGVGVPILSVHPDYQGFAFVCGVNGAKCRVCARGSFRGCCTANGQCRAGLSDENCGSDGVICTRCGHGRRCSDHACGGRQ
jgi:hypothetical protein